MPGESIELGPIRSWCLVDGNLDPIPTVPARLPYYPYYASLGYELGHFHIPEVAEMYGMGYFDGEGRMIHVQAANVVE